MSAEKLALHDESQLPPIPLATVQKAAHIIDTSDIPRLLDLWQSQDRKHPGGRPAHITMRAVLIVGLLLAMEHQPMHLTRVARVFLERLTPASAAVVGYVPDPDAHPDSIYDRARSAFVRINALTDAEPATTRHRRLTVAERRADLKWREDNPAIIERRRRRRDILHNALLEATYQLLPAKYRTERLSVAVDATRLRVYARGIGRDKLAELPDHAPVSTEPDAGFYVRNTKGEIPTKRERQRPRIIEYAREAELAVLGSNDGSRDPHAVPNIVVAFGMHIPAYEPVTFARRMLDSLWERGHKIDHFAADRAYLPAGDPDLLQNPLRLHGAKLVMDYPIKQLGIRAHAHGAILVEGTWYSPGMPTALINATATFRNACEKLRKDKTLTAGEREERRRELEALWRTQLAARSSYRLREKSHANENGQVPMMCPASGPNPLMTCPHRPDTVDKRKHAHPLLPIANPPREKNAICTNKTSTTFNIADGGSHAQHYEFESEEWGRQYHHLRNNVESFNDYLKDPGTFSLSQPGRRRMRGATADALLVVITIAAANLRKIRHFLEHKQEQELDRAEGRPAPESRSRRSRKTPAPLRITHRLTRNKRHKDTASPQRT